MVPPRLKHFEPTLTAQHYSLILLILHTVNFVSTTLLGPFHRYPFLFERRFFSRLAYRLPTGETGHGKRIFSMSRNGDFYVTGYQSW